MYVDLINLLKLDVDLFECMVECEYYLHLKIINMCLELNFKGKCSSVIVSYRR